MAKKSPPPSGFVFYEGPSMLTGTPIVAIATMHSDNSKTGNMIQTWILVQDRDPLAANRSGADIAICGKCPARGIATGANRGLAKKRSCYVDLVHGPLGIYTAWKAGRYPRVTGHAAIAAIGHGRKVRLGAYGDPAAVPAYVNQSLISESDGHTAYSHQSSWEGRTSGFDPASMMVSADSLSAASEAWARSWRTFRVVGSVDELVKGQEVLCPASEEAGKRTQCIRCLLCAGAGSRAKSVAIVVHGAGRKHHTAQGRA